MTLVENDRLNPFEIRAGQKHQTHHPLEAWLAVLIPLKSGQARNPWVVCINTSPAVLIPLKSGQARNRSSSGYAVRYARLNPFEIRAGQKLPAPKKRSTTRTCKGLYGFFRLAKRCLFWHSCQRGSLRSVSGFFQPAILNHVGLASGRRFQAGCCQAAGRPLQ